MSGSRSLKSPWRKVVALSGGVGGARLMHGLAAALPAGALSIVVNNGDDFQHWGLPICPDLDTVMYTLADLAPVERGWGLADESFAAFGMVRAYGGESWFQLGDKDLGTHILRRLWQQEGLSLTEVTHRLCQGLGLKVRLLPMSDAPSPTQVQTEREGVLSFQQWLVGRRGEPRVQALRFPACPAPTVQVLEALRDAELVVLGPSNPYVSIDPILRLPGVIEALGSTPLIGVSPIVSGAAVKGPLAHMIPSLAGRPPSAAAVADHYGARLRAWLVERGDEHEFEDHEELLIHGTATVMMDRAASKRLAMELLLLAERLL